MCDFTWSLKKIKLGAGKDIDIVKALRNFMDSRFRIDANASWGVGETSSNSIELKKLGVEFIDQTLEAKDWSGMEKAYAKSQLPLIAD